MASPWTSYDFDPEAGDGQGAYTFSDGKSTRTVANTAFAAQLAADIDAASGKSRDAGAAPFGGAAPPPDPMAGMARAEQAAAARVAPEWLPAQAALTGVPPLPNLDAFAARMDALASRPPAPAARPDPGAGLAPEAAQAARAIGTAPPPIDMDAIARRLEAIGKRPEAPAAGAAPPVGIAGPALTGVPPARTPQGAVGDLALSAEQLARDTGYERRAPVDMRLALLGGGVSGAVSDVQPALASMPEPLVSQAPPPAPEAAAPPPAPTPPAPAAQVGIQMPPSLPTIGRDDAEARLRALPAAVAAGDVDTVKSLTGKVVLSGWRGANDTAMAQWGKGLVAQAEAAREKNAAAAAAAAPAVTPPASMDPAALRSVDPNDPHSAAVIAQSAQASHDYQATATAAQMAKPPAPSAVRVGGPPREDPNIALIRARGAEALGFQDRQNAVDQEKSAGMAGFQEEIAIKAAENADALAKLRENQQREERALLGERNQAAQEVFAKQYDPDRFWKQRPAAGLLATIAVALGELGRGLQRSNGPNIGLTLVNQAIERDLDAQREEYGRAKDKLGIKNSAYAELRAKGLTDQQAMAAAHAQQLSLVDQRIKLFTANTDNEQMKLRGDQLRAGIQNETVDKVKAYEAAVARENAMRAQRDAAARDKQRKDQAKAEKDQAEVEEIRSRTRKNNADASGDNHLNTETRELGSALAPIIDAREQAAPLLQALAQLPEGEELPGYTMGANAVSMANSVVPFVNTRRALSDESNKNRNMVNQAFMGYRHAMTGAGGSDQEMKFLEETWKGAGTTAELRDAVQRSEAVLTNVERRRRAAFSERANATFDARGGAQTTTPIRSLRKVGP